MTDYFGHEINIGDTVIYVGKNAHGGRVSFSESVVTELKNGCVVVDSFNHHSFRTKDCRQSKNVINLTALKIRSRKENIEK